MPAWVWVVAAAAVLFVLWAAVVRGWWRSVRYSWRRARHVLAETEAERVMMPRTGRAFGAGPMWEYGSMNLDEEQRFLTAPADLRAEYGAIMRERFPVAMSTLGEYLPDWREQTAADLAPEALEDAGLCAACIMDDHCDGAADSCDCTCGWPEDWAEADDSGPGAGSSLAPGPDPAWLDGQLAVLYEWVRDQYAAAAA